MDLQLAKPYSVRIAVDAPNSLRIVTIPFIEGKIDTDAGAYGMSIYWKVEGKAVFKTHAESAHARALICEVSLYAIISLEDGERWEGHMEALYIDSGSVAQFQFQFHPSKRLAV